VDCNGRVSVTVEEEGGLLSKTDVVKTGLLESGVGELDGLDDFVTMGLKGETLVEDGTEVEKFGDLGDGEGGASCGGGTTGAPLERDVGWGVSWKTTILDLREEIVKWLRSQEV
jgi:hypothetical protein